MLTPPHGGRLIDRRVAAADLPRRLAEARELPQLRPEPGQILDAAKIADGSFSPLEGFMNEATLRSSIERGRLLDGLAWPIPVYLSPPGPANQRVLEQLAEGDDAALLDDRGECFAILHVRERYPLPRAAIAQHVFGTTDLRHPDVAALQSTGPWAVGGAIDLLTPPRAPLPGYELDPVAARELFRRRGWSTVAAYQTRNVPHLGHEHLQRLTLEREDIDGLFIHPVVGPLKPGDYRPEIVIAAYESLIAGYYPPDRVALATLTIAMRYAGPRAALFLAIVRQNFGCTHFIVGRDQAGVGGFYEPYACHRIFDEYRLEIVPVRFRELAYCPACRTMASEKTCRHPAAERVRTSQTRVRTAIAEHRPLPMEILRPEIAALLSRSDAIRPMAGPLPVPTRVRSGRGRARPPPGFARPGAG